VIGNLVDTLLASLSKLGQPLKVGLADAWWSISFVSYPMTHGAPIYALRDNFGVCKLYHIAHTDSVAEEVWIGQVTLTSR
jgi:hypothetical protein